VGNTWMKLTVWRAIGVSLAIDVDDEAGAAVWTSLSDNLGVNASILVRSHVDDVLRSWRVIADCWSICVPSRREGADCKWQKE
jgi:hypothetical protein